MQMTSHALLQRMTLPLTLTLLFFAMLWGPRPSQAQHPNHPLGESTDRLYQGGLDQIDQVDLMTGTLGIKIPIGPFSLTYNSNVWRYEQDVVNGNIVTTARPDRDTTAGLGWHLGLGEVYSPSNPYNDTNEWLYIGPDGSRHIFFQDMHMYDAEGDPTTLYTRDGQYLRLRQTNNYWVEVDFPDGSTQRFNSGTGGLATTYHLEQSWNAIGSFADPDLEVQYTQAGAVETRTITDRYGRTQVIKLRTDFPWIDKVVTEVHVEGFGGATNSYFFTYDTIPVDVSCKHDNPNASSRISIPHLSRIDLPDGTYYSMKDGAQLLYVNTCSSANEDVSGLLTGLQVPTGGSISWTYQEYEYPPGEVNSPFNTSAGVAVRTLHEADGTAMGSWTYRTRQYGVSQGTDPEVHTEVVSPTGDCTYYYFNARYFVTPSEGRGWEYGLPFTLDASSGGKYLSYQNYASSSGGACSGTLLRSKYVRYRKDRLPGSASYPTYYWYNSNRQIEASRVVFHLDGDRYIDLEYSEFDGLGHFRLTQSTSNFWSGSAHQELRTRYIHYNKVAGEYPGSFVTPAASDAWALDIYDYIEQQEPDAMNVSAQRIEYEFDPQTGALRCERSRKNAGARSTRDIITRYTRDAQGRVATAKRWGSDVRPVSVSGSGCGQSPGLAYEGVQYGYDVGVLTQATPILASGALAPYKTIDLDVDPSTGLEIRSRSASGRLTQYDYDAFGRIVEMLPEEGVRATYDYAAATAVRGPQVTITERAQVGGTTIYQEVYEADHFGRDYKHRRMLPSGSWTEQITETNARGWPLSVTEWGNSSRKTTFSGFDAFGRATRVTPPEGASHELKTTHQGVRRLTSERKVAMAGGEIFASQVREYDSQGRLRRLLESSGDGGATVATTYSYDLNGNLTRMVTGSGAETQVRSYEYDNHGFLISQTLPEKGVAGNGTITFGDFDLQGNPQVKFDGEHTLGVTYDSLGRILEIRDLSQGGRLVDEYFYDTAPGHGEGRLAYTIHHNWVDLPWNAQGVEDVQVQENYAYEGEAGSLSNLEVTYRWGNREFSFDQDFVYNTSGNLLSQTYPRCQLAACAGTPVATSMSLNYGYQRNRLTSISGWVDHITYANNGHWMQIRHANQARDFYTPDATNPNRPSRVRSLAIDGISLYDSGTIQYDGSGNIKAIGSDSYTYDEVGRLVSATTTLPYDPSSTWVESFDYDTFGNPISKTTTAPGQSPQSVTFATNSSANRLAAGTYDGAGNLLSWAGKTYEYDSGNQLVRAAWMHYLYNSRGERVGAFAESSLEGMSFFLRDDTDHLMSEITWSPTQGFTRVDDYVWAGDRLIGRSRQGGSIVEHYHLDHVGSIRGVSDAAGFMTDALSFTPFGEEVPYSTDGDLFHFAGHERVASSGLDAMHRRFYSSGLARFLSVDPVAGDPTEPQSMNRYTYGLNNPLGVVDPDGREERGFVGQNDPIRMPTNWNLQVMRQIGSHAPAARAMERLMVYGTTVPMLGMMGAPVGMVTRVTAWGAVFGGIENFFLSGFDPDAILPGALDGGANALIFSTLFGLPIQGGNNAMIESDRFKEVMSALVGTVKGAFDSLPKTRLADGGFMIIFKNGEAHIWDKDGNYVGQTEEIYVIGNDPGPPKDKKKKEEKKKEKKKTRPDLTHEDALRRIDDLQRGSCFIRPAACTGTGGHGFPGLGNRIQWY